ncbi:enoyl-CoA hydratase/isomerase family protein [Paraburkholderia lacunae]|uniref:enoyl-CoA hydratase/isomerase family protein n=1 Tax=Paraburkholderia lacunae TaxID=2211104 RepID=UPI001FCC21D0|nr:enoyl-CoA hydratase/isomerase family protein [Paraburkholderia lacunae]
MPKFFIAHSGLHRVGSAPKTTSNTRTFRLTQMLGERLRNMPKAVIAKVEGIARCGGCEIALAADMCFAAIGEAVFGQPEVVCGLVPCGGNTQRPPRRMGRARALEVLPAGADFSAELADRYGYINRALPAKELGPFVDKLARRIATFPPTTIAHLKKVRGHGVRRLRLRRLVGGGARGRSLRSERSDTGARASDTRSRRRDLRR